MSSPIPSPHKLRVRKYIPGAKDDWNNAVDSWADPYDWMVRSVDPVSNREVPQANRDLANIAYVVQADVGPLVPGYRDKVLVGDDEYDVDGRPDDWSKGPWPNPVAGVTVWLKRVEG